MSFPGRTTVPTTKSLRERKRSRTPTVADRYSPFPLLHHLHKILEQIMRIMRPRRGFGVILHAEQRQVAMTQAFQSRVVQIHVRQFNFTLRQRIRVHRKIVVVRGDLNLPRGQLLHGMISTVVSELQLESLSAESDAGELMSEANAEDGLPTHEPPNRINCIGTRLGVAGAVRQNSSIRLQG